jgi:hypothetical protein
MESDWSSSSQWGNGEEFEDQAEEAEFLAFSREQSEDDGADSWEATWLDRNYTGAPDECNIHWPTKGVTGECPDCLAEFKARFPIGMSLWWEVTYVPKSFSIKPTFTTDRKVWSNAS